MERVNPSARRDAYGSRINRVHSPVRAYSIPTLSVMAASILPFFFVSGGVAIIPPLGFLMLLGWRLVRPGLLPVWAGFPLGLFDDLFSGQPFGSAIFLWSAAMIAIEITETQLPRRSFAQDWTIFGLIILAYIFSAALLSGSDVSVLIILALGPQALLSVLLFPIIARMVARLDRIRLKRVRRVH
ncbi:rod shape-determining protein MreD [Pontixanthobacter luteolus]|uniref:rod shape-determining protein MreD n=1 Tax=Pontixanthobacter luteolus TaxID=295089 RepID=UPI002302ECC5|nr:rod shape-determining protein MreD [Pontixanthobacter luteolus]